MENMAANPKRTWWKIWTWTHSWPDGKYGHERTADLMENMDTNVQLTNLLGNACFADLDCSMFKNQWGFLHHHSTAAMGKKEPPSLKLVSGKTWRWTDIPNGSCKETEPSYGRERQAGSIAHPVSARWDNHNDRMISPSVYAVHLAQSVMFKPMLVCTLCVSRLLNWQQPLSQCTLCELGLFSTLSHGVGA